MRGVILTTLLAWLLLLWLVAQLYAFGKSKNKSTEAKLTVAYILGYPLLVIYLFSASPIPAAILFPAAMGALPWFLASFHLRKILAVPGYQANPGEFIGVPIKYWLRGGIGAFFLGLVLQYLEQL
jgi:hypothetical protein